MLELDAVDLDELCSALEDHSPEISWWFDPATGQVRPHVPDVDDEDVDELDARGLVVIEPVPSHEAFGDMEDFVARVADQRVAGQLERALGGRGPFRRFRDVLYDHDELREQWSAFSQVRMRRRAIEWLADEGLVAREAAQRVITEHDHLSEAHTDTSSLAAGVAGDLRALYGGLLSEVLVFGSRARGEADEDSHLDLLVVLDDVDSPWDELRRMDEVLWRHTEASGVVISALPVSRAEVAQPSSPVLIRATAEAVPSG